MNYTKTSILFVATFSLFIAPAIIEDAFAAQRIPGFMKTNIEWYAAGQISEDEFINALTYLMNKDIIVLDQARADAIKELRDENQALRKQVTQYRESDFDFAQRMQETSKQTPKTDFGSTMKPGATQGAGPSMGGAVASSMVGGMHSTQIQDEITRTTQELASLYDALDLIMEKIKQHQANKPDSWDHTDDPARFDQALKVWNNDMDSLLNQLEAIQFKIQKVVQKLEQLQGELSTAQRRDQAEMQKMMEKQHGEMKQQMDTAAHQMGPNTIQKKHISNLEIQSMRVQVGDTWHHVMMAAPADEMSTDINALVQEVMRESYSEANQDLKYYAEKVRHFNDMKDAVRDYLHEMREKQSEYADYQTATKTTTVNPDIANPNLAVSGTTSYDRLTMKADLDEHEGTISEFLQLQKKLESAEADIQDIADRIQKNLDAKKQLRDDIAKLQDIMAADRWPVKYSHYDDNGRVISIALNSAGDAWNLAIKFDERLQTLDDDAQLMNIDLQNAMQKQQQTLQTMSNVSKMLHDTAMAIIRKIG